MPLWLKILAMPQLFSAHTQPRTR